MFKVLIEAIAGVCLLQAFGTLFMAGMAAALRVPVSEVSIGVGPVIAAIGRFKLRLILVSGSVKLLKVAQAESPEQLARVIELQPVWKPVVLQLFGPALIAAVAVLWSGKNGFRDICLGFTQILIGAVRPFSSAQTYLHDFVAYADSHGAIDVLMKIATKLAALSFLPIIPSPGFMALFILYCRLTSPSHRDVNLPIWWIIPTFVIYMGWALALGYAAFAGAS